MKDEITREEAILALNKIREEIIELRKKGNLLLEQKESFVHDVDLIEKESNDLFFQEEKERKESYLEMISILGKSFICSLLILISFLNLIMPLTASKPFLPFQMSYILFISSTLLEVYYARSFFQKEKSFNKNHENAIVNATELLNQLDNIMAKSEEIDHQLNRISTQIEEKENQVSFIARVIETLDHMKESNKEKEPVSVMTTMIENEDEFIKENKQVKVKTKK